MKIGIVGIGRVGSELAFGLLFNDKVDCIALNDIDRNKMAGELEDLEQASSIMGKKISFTADFGDCNYIFICAGYARSRANGTHEGDKDLFKKNLPIVSMIFEWLAVRARFEGSPLVSRTYIVTNPPEMLAKYFQCKAMGKFLDDFREKSGSPSGLWILDKKGYTNHGIVAECLKIIDAQRNAV